MTWIVRCSLFFLVCIVPAVALAQLSSENFVIEGASVGSPSPSSNATSASYDTDVETGGLYILNATTPTVSGSGPTTGTRVPRGAASTALQPLLVGPSSVVVGSSITIGVRVPGASAADVVQVSVDGANAGAHRAGLPVGELFVVSYTARNAGVDAVTATLNGVPVAYDTDGNSDGTLHVTVVPGALTTPGRSAQSGNVPVSPDQLPNRAEPFAVTAGITTYCNRLFTWEYTGPVTVRRAAGSRSIELATILPRMPWFIDTDPLDTVPLPVTYYFSTPSGQAAEVTYDAADFANCTSNAAATSRIDIDGDQIDELYVEGVFFDPDGVSVPLATGESGGVFIDTNFDSIPDLYWSAVAGTSTVIVAADRTLVVAGGGQDFEPYVEGGYRVSIAPPVRGISKPIITATYLRALLVPETLAAEAEEVPAASTIRIPVVPPFWVTVLMAAGVPIGLLWTLLNAMQSPFSVSRIGMAYTRGWRFLFGSLVPGRKRHPWGTVYDSVTKAPVDPAIVELVGMDGVAQATAITDLDGRYGFLVEQGEYQLRVKKVNYQFPSTRRTLSGTDLLYAHPYYGGPFRAGTTVVHDIPMDPLSVDWNQQEKLRTNQMRFYRVIDPFIAHVLNITFWLGTAAMLYQVVSNPTPATMFFCIVYLLMLVLRVRQGKPPLYGYLRRRNTPLAFAVIRFYRGEHVVASKVADRFGRYVALLSPGEYTMTVDERRAENSYVTVYSKHVVAKKGYVNQTVTIRF